MKYRIGVIFGGESVEHEISIISAQQAIKALDQEKYQVFPIYVSKQRQLYFGDKLNDIVNFKDLDKLINEVAQVTLVKNQQKVEVMPIKAKLFAKPLAELDLIIPIVHGTNCEDGTIQGFLEMLKVPYAGCSVMAAAAGQDKVFMKHILTNCKIPIVPWTWFYSCDFERDEKALLNRLVNELDFPMIVKPANLGSSVGIATANNIEELSQAIKQAKQFDQKIVVEKLLTKIKEYNCSILGNHNDASASAIEEVMSTNELLTYDDKYLSGSKAKGMVNTSRIIPADLSEKRTEEVQELAKSAFMALDASGVVRVDLIRDMLTDKFYVNEINTIPGSLSFYLWQAVGVDFSELMDRLVALAIENYRIKESLTFSYSTNVLSNVGGIKGVKK